jgi:hypothetical protein
MEDEGECADVGSVTKFIIKKFIRNLFHTSQNLYATEVIRSKIIRKIFYT